MTEASPPVHARPAPAAGKRRSSRRAAVLLLLAVALLVAQALIGEQGLGSAFATWRTYHRLGEQVQALRAENTRLRLDAIRLRGDLAAIEAIARRDLGLVRPGEKVFLLRDEPPDAPASPRP